MNVFDQAEVNPRELTNLQELEQLIQSLSSTLRFLSIQETEQSISLRGIYEPRLADAVAYYRELGCAI
jgi:hypothetical protein